MARRLSREAMTSVAGTKTLDADVVKTAVKTDSFTVVAPDRRDGVIVAISCALMQSQILSRAPWQTGDLPVTNSS
jgi:hypothetical protein